MRYRPGVSVVIPARNAASTIGDQLRALSDQTYDGWWEIIVVDNGSDDATAEIAESWRTKLARLRVLRAPAARGAAGARNVGARAGQGDLLLFCDADDVVDREWVAQLAKGLADYPVAGGQIDRLSLNTPVQLAWRPARPLDSLPDHFGFLPYIPSANCAVRRAVWDEHAGFDETFRHSEDVDLCWRLQLCGHEAGYIPGAMVSYRYRTGLMATARQNYDYGTSHARLYQRYAEAGMPRAGARQVLSEWWWIAAHLPAAVYSRKARGAWLARAARAAGRLAGSVGLRTVYL